MPIGNPKDDGVVVVTPLINTTSTGTCINGDVMHVVDTRPEAEQIKAKSKCGGPVDVEDIDIDKTSYKSPSVDIISFKGKDIDKTGSESKCYDVASAQDNNISSSEAPGHNVEVHRAEDRRPPFLSPTCTSPSGDELRRETDKTKSLRHDKSLIGRPDEATISPSEDETANITCAGTHDNDSVYATADRFHAALPAAYAVDEYDLPVAYQYSQADTEKDEKKDEGRKNKCGITVVILLAICVVVLIAVGATIGFKPTTKPVPFDSKSIEDSDELAQSSDSGKSKSSSSDDDAPPPCPPFVPVREYTHPSDAYYRYCKEGRCWEQVGPTMLGLLQEKFGNHIKFNSAGDRFALSSFRAGSCNGGDIGIIRVYDMNASYDFNQIGQTIEGLEEGDYARGVLSGDGRRLAVGYPKHRSYDLNNAGAFLVYELNETSGNWTALGKPLYGTAKKTRFGHSLAISNSGDILAVGAPVSFDRKGAVHVYRFRPQNLNHTASTKGVRWEQMGKAITLPNNENATLPMFGYKVRLSANGRTLVIGRKNEDEIDAGGVVAFRYIEEEDIWAQLGDEITGLGVGDAFGRHLAASFGSGALRIAAAGKDEYLDTNSTSTGYIRVFELDERNKTWTPMGSPIIGEIPGIKLNTVSLSANGTRLAACTARAFQTEEGGGYFRVYDFIGGEWRQVGGQADSLKGADKYGLDLHLSPDGSLMFSSRPELTHAAVRLYKLVNGSSLPD